MTPSDAGTSQPPRPKQSHSGSPTALRQSTALSDTGADYKEGGDEAFGRLPTS